MNKVSSPLLNGHNTTKKKFIIFLLVVIAVMACVMLPAFAEESGSDALTTVTGETTTGAVSDVVGKVFLWAVKFFAGLLQKIVTFGAYLFVLAIREITPDTVTAMMDSIVGQINGTSYSIESIIVGLGIFIAALICIVTLIKTITSGLAGVRVAQSPITVAIRLIIAIVMATSIALPLGKGLFTIFSTAHANGLEWALGAMELSTSVPITSWTSLTAEDTAGLSAGLAAVLAPLVTTFVLVVVYLSFLKLCMELAQRIAIVIIYVYLGPLAAGCFVTPETGKITQGWFSGIIKQGVLMILNGWSVAVAMQSINQTMAQKEPLKFLGYALLSYGIMKALQQLDDVFNNVGASVVRQTAGLLADIMALNNLGKAFGNMKDNYNNFKSKLRDTTHSGGTLTGALQAGSNRNNSGTNTTGGAGGAGSTGGTANAPKNTVGEAIKNTAANIASNSLVGSAAIGAVSRVSRVAGKVKSTSEARAATTAANDIGTKARNAAPAIAAASANLANANNAVGGAKNNVDVAARKLEAARASRDTDKEQKAQLDYNHANTELQKANGNVAAAQRELDAAQSETSVAAQQMRASGALENPTLRADVAKAAGMKNGEEMTSLTVGDDGKMTATFQTKDENGNVTAEHKASGITMGDDDGSDKPFGSKRGKVEDTETTKYHQTDREGTAVEIEHTDKNGTQKYQVRDTGIIEDFETGAKDKNGNKIKESQHVYEIIGADGERLTNRSGAPLRWHEKSTAAAAVSYMGYRNKNSIGGTTQKLRSELIPHNTQSNKTHVGKYDNRNRK